MRNGLAILLTAKQAIDFIVIFFQSLGWPCVGAQMAAFRRLWEKLPPQVRLKIIPRGSDLATAAAIEAHEKAL